MSILEHIDFCPELTGCMAIEQEFFLGTRYLADIGGSYACGYVIPPVDVMSPLSPQFLSRVSGEDPDGRWTYELSKCQVEYRTDPHLTEVGLEADLRRGHEQGRLIARALGQDLLVREVGPLFMPLDVYPCDRYRQIVERIPKKMLMAACRVTSVQIHYGCRNIEHAIEVHRKLTQRLDELCKMGDNSGGKRLCLYKRMASHWQPPYYESAQHFEQVACDQGWANNPKDCWHLIRISRYGTIELRCLGNTDDIDRIMSWVRHVRSIIES